jgi:hypothetical protein
MTGAWTRRLRRVPRLGIVLLVILLTACADTPPSPEPASTGEPSVPPSVSPTPSLSSSSPPSTEEPSPVSTVRITIDDQVVTAQLADNPTADDLAAQLPLTLRIRDFNRLEKVANLPRPLTMEGVPAGDDPEINDLGYYAPSNDLVFYYGDVGYFDGIVRLGRFNSQDMDLIERQPDGREITIERG